MDEAAGSLKRLGHTVVKTASGPTSNSYAFNSDLIRPLKGFSASFLALSQLRPISVFFFISFYSTFCLFLSSFSLLLFLSRTMQRLSHISLPFLPSVSPLHVARIVFLSHTLFCVPVLYPSCFHPLFILSYHDHQLRIVHDLPARVQTPDSFFFTLTPLVH